MQERYYNLQDILQQLEDIAERETIADELRSLGDYVYDYDLDEIEVLPGFDSLAGQTAKAENFNGGS